jgi:hypothetical protein
MWPLNKLITQSPLLKQDKKRDIAALGSVKMELRLAKARGAIKRGMGRAIKKGGRCSLFILIPTSTLRVPSPFSYFYSPSARFSS